MRISGFEFGVGGLGFRVEDSPVIEPTGGKTVMMFVVYRYRKGTVLTCHHDSQHHFPQIKAFHPCNENHYTIGSH